MSNSIIENEIKIQPINGDKIYAKEIKCDNEWINVAVYKYTVEKFRIEVITKDGKWMNEINMNDLDSWKCYVIPHFDKDNQTRKKLFPDLLERTIKTSDTFQVSFDKGNSDCCFYNDQIMVEMSLNKEFSLMA